MAVGDVHITFGNLAAGASVQVQSLTRAKVIAGFSAIADYCKLGISSDGATYYQFVAVGFLEQGASSVTTVANQSLYLPANYYVQLTNTDTTNAHNYMIELIEY